MVIRYIEFIGSWISYYLLFGLLDFTGFSGSGSFGFLELDAGCFQGYGSGLLDLDFLVVFRIWIWTLDLDSFGLLRIWIWTFGFGFGCFR